MVQKVCRRHRDRSNKVEEARYVSGLELRCVLLTPTLRYLHEYQPLVGEDGILEQVSVSMGHLCWWFSGDIILNLSAKTLPPHAVHVSIDTPVSSSSLDEPLTERETVHLALIFCFFWFIANWTINAALGMTSVTSATILSSMSGARYTSLTAATAYHLHTFSRFLHAWYWTYISGRSPHDRQNWCRCD